MRPKDEVAREAAENRALLLLAGILPNDWPPNPVFVKLLTDALYSMYHQGTIDGTAVSHPEDDYRFGPGD